MNPLSNLFGARNRSSRRHDRKSAPRRRTIMMVEPMEGRQLLSTFTVTNISNSGSGSLRWAITQASAANTSSTINFKIPESKGVDGEYGYYYPINLQSSLPKITKPVTIDGLTESGATASQPNVELYGKNVSGSAIGLDITASHTTVEGLAVDGFKNGGVLVLGASKVTINEDWIGVRPYEEGSTSNGNSYGVELASSSVGTTNSVVADSVISGNTGTGVILTGSGTNNNLVEGDVIGLAPGGLDQQGNQGDGVLISGGASYNSIGGTAISQGNVISSNSSEGVEISGATTSHNLVAGNIIGLDSSTDFARQNGDNGVKIDGGAFYNTVGGSTSSARNIISGNHNSGVVITDSGTSSNSVAGNYIGTDKTGETGTNSNGDGTLGNGWDGVLVESSASSTQLSGNVISNNGENGVSINNVSNVIVVGNDIGTDAAGMKALGNGADGVIVHASAANVTIGGASSGQGNVISANGGDGVDLNSASNVTVKGNDIGTDKNGDLQAQLHSRCLPSPVEDHSFHWRWYCASAKPAKSQYRRVIRRRCGRLDQWSSA